MISYVLPTRNRPDRLARTLAALGQIHASGTDDAEVIVVVDGGGDTGQIVCTLNNGWPVTTIRLPESSGAAARNAGVEAAQGDWVAMLDDDSHPLDASATWLTAAAPADVAAIGGAITLPGGRHEDGGLPEVFVGCGGLVRRDAFLAVGGYDPSFHYYVEEYDLCAKLLAAGYRVIHDWRWQVLHEKVAAGRDFNAILSRLVRNGGWIIARYAPAADHEVLLARHHTRYAEVARREGAEAGYAAGRDALASSWEEQPRTPLASDEWDRFVGRAAVQASIEATPPPPVVRLVATGKHAWIVRETLVESGVDVVDDPRVRDVAIATLSPGPLVDAVRGADPADRVWTPWRPANCTPVLAGRPGFV